MFDLDRFIDDCRAAIAEDASHKAVRKMFDEQIQWAVDASVDFIIGETYSHGGEALIGLAAIKAANKPAVERPAQVG